MVDRGRRVSSQLATSLILGSVFAKTPLTRAVLTVEMGKSLTKELVDTYKDFRDIGRLYDYEESKR